MSGSILDDFLFYALGYLICFFLRSAYLVLTPQARYGTQWERELQWTFIAALTSWIGAVLYLIMTLAALVVLTMGERGEQ